jgi:hypothetical protein
VVDSTEKDPYGRVRTKLRLTEPRSDEAGKGPEEKLADHLHEYLKDHGGAFTSTKALMDSYRAQDGTKLSNNAVGVALQILVIRGLLNWPETGEGRARPGNLIDQVTTSPTRYDQIDQVSDPGTPTPLTSPP